jgi:hypothetical protein
MDRELYLSASLDLEPLVKKVLQGEKL